jgi:hypothetical protein
MKKKLIITTVIALLAHNSAHAINAKYRKQLERSGCTQVTESQGCDITKTKNENAKAGFVGVGASQGKSVNLDDLKGMESIKAIDEMTAREFKGVDTITSGNTLYGIYYNPSTRQCIQITNADNKVYAVNDIQTHPKCR